MTAQEKFFNDFADMVRPEVDTALDTAILTLLEFFGDLETVKRHAGERTNYKHNIGDDVVLYMIDNTIEVHDKAHGEWFALELSTSRKSRHHEDIDRVAEVARDLWNRLSDADQEDYLGDVGTIVFLRRVIELLNYKFEDFAESDIEYLLTEVFMSDTPSRKSAEEPMTMVDFAQECLFGSADFTK
jgi:hypothetical protein